MPTTDAFQHVVPSATGEAPARAAFDRFSASIRDIKYVANTTARATLIANLVAAAKGPSTSNPVFVWRGDATSGRELEYTVDGTNWKAYRPAAAWATYAPTLSGFAGTVNKARWIDEDGMVTVQLAITLTAAPTGTMRVSLPVTAAGTNLTAPVGLATGHTGSQTQMGPVIIPATTQMGVRHSSTSEWNGTTPFAWASGHVLGITATLERA